MGTKRPMGGRAETGRTKSGITNLSDRRGFIRDDRVALFLRHRRDVATGGVDRIGTLLAVFADPFSLLFQRIGLVLQRVMKIDANARSSMWEDLQRGRSTEIDYLQGVLL